MKWKTTTLLKAAPSMAVGGVRLAGVELRAASATLKVVMLWLVLALNGQGKTGEARKVLADANGVETPMPLADFIDIGVFSGKKDEEKPLYMQREKITREHETFTIMVDRQPTRAGIDPYNKLIDRISDDNMIDVTEM